MKNILEQLEYTAVRFADKVAVDDGEVSYSWQELLDLSKRVGSALAKPGREGRPIAVVMDKRADTLAAFFGIVYAGGFYVLVNPEYPNVRIEKILETLQTDTVVLEPKYKDKIRACGYAGEVLEIDAAKAHELREDLLSGIRARATDKDILYGIFTSGSTGVPKGVIVSHRAVIDFIGYFTELFGFSEDDIIGNQAPLDFDVSVKDIYASIFTGAKLVLIPKHMFSMPPALLDFLCEKRVTSLTWAVSALCIVTTLRGFEYRIPSDVKRVLFSGEVMPYKHLHTWREALPKAEFVNLYGPTEITCNCTYYRVRGDEEPDTALPVGRAFPNRRVFLLDEENHEVTEPGENGEICVAGSSLAAGYYNNAEATEKSFVQNPGNSSYPERIYRTGDNGYWNKDGELCFLGRRDFQIKRMGHRIDLEEILLTIENADAVARACCIYGESENKLVAFYVGTADKKTIRRDIREQMPGFMMPDKFFQVEEMPLTKNGKIDRTALWNRYKEEKKR